MAKIYPLIFLLFFALTPLSARAASLFFSEPAASYNVGSTFSLSVFAGSANQTINAASGVISFPADKLEVTSISKTNSIFSLWVQEPVLNNNAGTVSFEGIVLNPGYTGANGKILTLNFKTKAAGRTNLEFMSGSVLANDGSGTNILDSLRTAAVTIGSQATPPPEIPKNKTSAVTVVDPNAPVIVSAAHANQDAWYANSSPEFSWDLPTGALEVRTLIGRLPNSTPIVSYRPPIANKKVEALPDGTYYFHLQIRRQTGWSSVAHYRVNVDTIPPEPFSIIFPHGQKELDARPVITFNTTDKQSGISHYNITLSKEGKQHFITSVASNPYTLPAQEPGTYTVSVDAVDMAGNVRPASADFTLENASGLLEVAPVKESGRGEGDVAPTRDSSGLNFGILAALLILIIMIGVGVWFWYRLLRLSRRLRGEVARAEVVLDKSTDGLHKDMKAYIKKLKAAQIKRKLTSEESSFLKHFE